MLELEIGVQQVKRESMDEVFERSKDDWMWKEDIGEEDKRNSRCWVEIPTNTSVLMRRVWQRSRALYFGAEGNLSLTFGNVPETPGQTTDSDDGGEDAEGGARRRDR